MKRLFFGFDWGLFLGAVILATFGLLVNYFLIPENFFQQLFSVLVGIAAFFIFKMIDFRLWEKLKWELFGGSLAFLLTPFLFGTITRGAFRWLRVGPFTLQPSELVKPFLLIFFASFFANFPPENFKRIFWGFLLLLPPLFLIFFQPDLGSSLVIAAGWLGILIAAGIPISFIFFGGGAAMIFLPIFWRFLLHDYQRQRVLSFLNPSSDPLGRGYNLIQSTVAVGAGQFFGRGLGRGTQSHLHFLPERHTDFIFASFAEDFGFLGVCILLLAFFVLFWRILRIAQRAKNSFSFLFCLGGFCLIFFQTFINIGMNIGLLPITGIPLPLVSYGGSSFLATMIILGIIENICYNNNR